MGLTQQEIASRVGVSRERVRQIERDALRKMFKLIMTTKSFPLLKEMFQDGF
jgi:DNA-directed RNA polymerase sigma subunit (sigma70/sigma32)